MPAAAARCLAYSSVVSGAKLRMLDLNPVLLNPQRDTNTRTSRKRFALTRTPKKRIRARRFRAPSLYIPRADFKPVAIGIETMATGLWEKRSAGVSRRCRLRSVLPTRWRRKSHLRHRRRLHNALRSLRADYPTGAQVIPDPTQSKLCS